MQIRKYLSVAVLVLSCLLPFAANGDQLQTVTPQDRLTGRWWGPRHEEKVAQAKTGKADLVMIGDSITHNWEKQKDYAETIGSYNILNLGFGGDRTENVLWRIEHGELDGVRPNVVTMMIGTNNAKRDKPEDIVEGIKAIVAELRERLPDSKIAVFSIFPRKPGKENDTVKAVNAMLPQLTDNKQVFHVDINQHFLDANGEQNAELYGRDLLHLSAGGYETWFNALVPVLAESGLEAGEERPVTGVTRENKPVASVNEGPVIRLWPIEMIGGEQNRLKEEFRKRKNGEPKLSGVKDPNLTVYRTASTKPAPAVVYCPGGGYSVLGPDPKLVQWLNDQGITVFMLKYTIPGNREAAFKDVQRAMRVVRDQAKKWNIDPNNLGVIGQSAGGHLITRLSQNYTQPAYEPIDGADKQSCEPQFAIVVSGAYFLGAENQGPGLASEFHMSNKVAPTFLVYAKDDKWCSGGVAYDKGLKESGFSTQLQLYEKGGHGLGGVNWHPECTKWLEANKIIR